jgi:hypothetical protein
MSQLEQATQRLDAAIARLEQAAAAGGEATAASAASAEVERDNAVLRDRADAVAGRLDKAIDRLKTLLES